MIKLKNIVFILMSIAVLTVVIFNFKDIKDKVIDEFNNKDKIILPESNIYKNNFNYLFIKQVDDYVPDNKKDLINIIYSIINQGWDEFTFYCPIEYEDCISDLTEISHNDVLLSNINNFVHPYNSYSSIKTLYDDTGEITLHINHTYSDSEIERIDKDIDKLISDKTNDDMDLYTKIKTLHDYIINNTKYDTQRANKGNSAYASNKINGVLYDHFAICSGYSDIMAVILTKLGVENYKISSDTHVWNAVNLDGWLHLDLTWDDPVTTNGRDIISHDYFMVTTKELKKLDNASSDHKYDEDIYLEFK